jgi:hypothetical protein
MSTSTFSTSIHWRAMLVAGDHVELPALAGHPGVFDRHLCRQDRTRTAEIGIQPRQVRQRADLDRLVFGGSSRRNGKAQRRAEQQRRYQFGLHCNPFL